MTSRDLTFRVFVSSTFSDLVAERNALQEHVFPRLREFCQKRGARFQAIDLRWGVSEEAALDQQTMNICLEELHRCQRTTPRPNFIVLLGQRYGWCPLPPQIEAAEFESLLVVLPDPEQHRLRLWYRRDDNAVPAEYCLQSREGRFKEGAVWATEERELRVILRGAINLAGWATTDARRLRYETSATHQEILHGALQIEDATDHVFAFIRTVEGLSPEAIAGAFLEVDLQGRPDPEARRRLDRLQAQMQTRLPNNIQTYSATWTDTGPSTDHLQQLCADVYDRLSKVIEEEVQRRDRSDLVDQEAIAHSAFGYDRARDFIGRENTLAHIREYVQANNRHPLVLHGVSGVGKSALMAKAIADSGVQNAEFEIVSRFIGATPASSDLRALLEGLCKEITFRYGGDASSVPVEVRKLEQNFSERLALATANKPLAVFLDALDQVSPADGAHQLSWLPRELPPHVKMVVSVLEEIEVKTEVGGQSGEFGTKIDDCLAVLRGKLPAKNLVRIEPLTVDCGAQLLDAWLAEAKRTLQPQQRQQVLDNFSANGLPLYLKLAFEEARRWKSWAAQVSAPMILSRDIPSILRDLFTRLELPQHHGVLMVSRALGYLAAGLHGLTEDELLDVLSVDKEVMADFIHHSPTERAKPSTQQLKALPVLVWSRLRIDLEPYLSERVANGATVLSFYHHQVGEVIRDKYFAGDVKLRSHRHLASYFLQKADPTQDGMWRGNYVRGLSELPYHQTQGQLWTELENTLCNLEFVSAACNASLVDDLISNLDIALHSTLAAQAESRSSLEELRDFVVREGHLLRWYARTPGFVRQHAFNKGLSHAQNRGPDGPWFREVRSAKVGEPLLAVLGQHSKHVNECAVSPKAGTIISISLDQSVRRWEINTWRQNDIVSVLPKGGSSCDVSIDGLTVVSGCLDGHVRIHRGGETIVCEGSFKRYPSRCRLFAGEQRILSVGDSGDLMVHDVASGRLLAKLSLDSDLHACSFSPDGKAALACENGNVLIYDPAANRITHTIRACVKTFGCAFSPDSRYLVAVGGHDLYLMNVKPYGEVVLFEAPDWHKIPRPERKWPELATGCTFLPDGHRYAVAFYDGMIRILDALDPDLAIPIKAHSASVRSLVAFKSNGGECLLTASSDSEIRAWDIALLTTATERARPVGRAIFCAFSNNTPQTWVWFAKVSNFNTDFAAAEYDFTPQSVSTPRIEDLPPKFPAAREFGIFSHDLAPDMPKDMAAISGWRKGSRNVHRSSPFSDWDTFWIVAASARLTKHAFHLVPSLPDGYFKWGNLTWARSVGRQIAILRHDQLLIVSPGSTHALSVPMQHTERPHLEQPQCQYSRDGARIYIGYANELRVVAATTGKPLASCDLEAEVACISESEEGDSLCAGCESGQLVEWNWQTGQQTLYTAHPHGVTDCSYASRHHLLSISNDGIIRLWERGTPEQLALFPAAASLSAFALNPVDNRIIIADVHGDVGFLFLENISEEAPKASVLPPAELPTVRELLHSLLQSDSIIEYLASEFANISSSENLAIVYRMMAHLFEVTDRAIADDLHSAASRFKSTVDVLAAAAEVERKIFGPSEVIVQVSQVIRGIARILNATRASDFDYALDVSRRFAWPRTRMALLLAIYGIAEAGNHRDTMKVIAPMLAGT